jgi:TerC family integral membrane protein
MHTPDNLLFWILFLAFVVVMLGLDLWALKRETKPMGMKVALLWSALWVGLAAGFGLLVYFFGHQMTGNALVSNRQLTLEFTTAYLVEESLSIDNLFVFLLIFRFFKVPQQLQRKALLWGIFGAIIMRAIFIAAGLALLHRFHWVIYIFGAIILYAGFKLLFQKETEQNPAESFVIRFAKRHLRFTDEFAGGSFTVTRNGVRYFTTLALVVLVVETTDLIFAVDSIPAVLAVTQDPFIVFTSNVFAILGLRAIYFALAGLMDLFHLLHYGLAAILLLIGVKMLGSHFFQIPILYTFTMIVLALGASIVMSLIKRPRHAEQSSAN